MQANELAREATMLKTLSATSLSVALAAVFAASGAATSPAAAATKYCDGPKVTWKISLFGKRRAVTEGVEAISQYAKDQTCGKFDYKIYYGEQLSKAKENLDGIKVGALEGSIAAATTPPGRFTRPSSTRNARASIAVRPCR
jgi:TRAP-type C4-dicarboxylate transport system substrate-binding protein